MRNITALLIVLALAIAAPLPTYAQRGAAAAPGYRAPRTADGKPNLSGIWQALNEANWDLEPHNSGFGTAPTLGAINAVPPGMGIVEGGAIPYKPEALAKKKENFANRGKGDPEAKCYRLGVPRSMYAPYPFQIIQSTDHIMIVFQFANSLRTVYMTNPKPAPAESWMGWSNGHWEGETLVIETTGFNDQTWLDRAGNYHSNALKVTERFTLEGDNLIRYTATIEDPKVFSRPWTISLPLYRRMEPNVEILEFKCVPFVEELLYKDLELTE